MKGSLPDLIRDFNWEHKSEETVVEIKGTPKDTGELLDIIKSYVSQMKNGMSHMKVKCTCT